MKEMLDIYTREGKHLGVKTRSECHQDNPGFYHKPVWIWIYNDNGEFLVQKRSKYKKTFPNTWDIPSAGHVEAGESSINGAIREIKEELGVDTKPEDYKYVGEYISEITWEIGQIYVLKLNIKAKDFKLQEEEVEQVAWLSFDEFKNLIHSDSFVPYDKELKDLSLKILEEYK